MDINTIVLIAGALGLGSILSAIVNSLLNRTKTQIDTNYAMRNELRGDLDKARARIELMDSQNDDLIVENAKLQGQLTVITGQVETLREDARLMAEEVKALRQNEGSFRAEASRMEREILSLKKDTSQLRDELFGLATKNNILHDENRLLRATLDRNNIQVPELKRTTDPTIAPGG